LTSIFVQEVASCAARALCLQGLSLVRRNGEYHHFDVLGTVGVVTDAGGTVLSSDLFDAFGVLRHAQGQAATPWRWQSRKLAEEGLLAACGGAYQLPARALPLQTIGPVPCEDCEAAYQACVRLARAWYDQCLHYVRDFCGLGIVGASIACARQFKGHPSLIAACVAAYAIVCGDGGEVFCYLMYRAKERRCLEEKAAWEACNRRRGYRNQRGAATARQGGDWA
jgi:hypothetical protein